METYPSIPVNITNSDIFAFDKLDGSNIRVEWTRKNGFSKFGTRTRLLDPNEKPLGQAVELFNEKYSDELSSIFRKQRFDKTTAFFEFHGANSFAGFHENETHEVTLFDLHIYKKGMLPAKGFLDLFEDKVDIAPVLYAGKPNQNFIESVRNSFLQGMTFEGVVCKGGLDKMRRPIMFKIKSEAWLQAVRNKYAGNESLISKLI